MKTDMILFAGAVAVAYLLLHSRAQAATKTTTSGYGYDGVTIGSEQARMLAEQDAGLV